MENGKYWDAGWNPVTGCTPVSEGCANCYAKRIYDKYFNGHKFEDVKVNPDRLEKPKHMKPKVIFVDSMSDLFHEKVPFDFIDQVFEVMINNPQHIFLVCTKRSKRMMEYFGYRLFGPGKTNPPVTENIWMGVTVESQAHTDRIEDLLHAPVVHRYVSYEPALGALDLEPYLGTNKIEGVVFGGETGNGARTAHISDARSARDQCIEAGVDFFFKQWGEYRPATESEETFGVEMVKAGRYSAGRMLDGREWNDLPWKKKPVVEPVKAPVEVQLALTPSLSHGVGEGAYNEEVK